MHLRQINKSRRTPEEVEEGFLQFDQPNSFIIREFPIKGRGVVADRNFSKGEFLLFYAGKLISRDEGERKEELCPSGFRFFFKYERCEFCIDATDELTTGPCMGRLVNHAGDSQSLDHPPSVDCVVDECAADPCDTTDGNCTSSDVSYTSTCTCNEGYELNVDGRTCDVVVPSEQARGGTGRSHPYKEVRERKYTRWTEKETTLVKQHFHHYFDCEAETTLPGRAEVCQFLMSHKDFKHDLWTTGTKIMNDVRKQERIRAKRLEKLGVSEHLRDELQPK